MASEKVGYRRLYDSMGCSTANNQTLHLVFPVGENFQVEVYLGAKPKFGIVTKTDHDDYLIPGSSARMGKLSYHGDATQSRYPRSFFTEIVCLRDLGVQSKSSQCLMPYSNQEGRNNTSREADISQLITYNYYRDKLGISVR